MEARTVRRTASHSGNEMIEDSPGSRPEQEAAPATSHGLPLLTALMLTILCALVAVAGSIAVARGSTSTTAKASLSIVTLVAIVGLGYSIFQLLLALVATTGERRWLTRDVSERRTGDRARKPPTP